MDNTTSMINVESGVAKIPANATPITEMSAGDFVTAGLKVGAFAGIAYLATQAIVGTARGICSGVKAGCSAAAAAAKGGQDNG